MADGASSLAQLLREVSSSFACDIQGDTSEEFTDPLGMFTWLLNSLQSLFSDRPQRSRGTNGVLLSSRDRFSDSQTFPGVCCPYNSRLTPSPNRKRKFSRFQPFSDENCLLSTVKSLLSSTANLLKIPFQFSIVNLNLFTGNNKNKESDTQIKPYLERLHTTSNMETAQPSKNLFFKSRLVNAEDPPSKTTASGIRPMEIFIPQKLSFKYSRPVYEHRFPFKKCVQDSRFSNPRPCDATKAFKKLSLAVDEDVQKGEREKYKRLLEIFKGNYNRKDETTDKSSRTKFMTEKPKDEEGMSRIKINCTVGTLQSPENVDLSACVASCLSLNNEPVSTAKENTCTEQSSEMGKNFITKEMEKEIKQVLGHGDADDVLSSAFKLKITRQDFWTLKNKHWLNDEIINFYVSLLVERSKQNGLPKLHSFSTFFYQKLLSGGYQAVRRWTKCVNLFEKDIILLPVHLDVHWSLLVCDLRKKTIKYYDSVGQDGYSICEEFLKYLQEESKVKRNLSLNVAKWKLHSMKPHEIPQQMNGSDCGVFVCKYADYISRDKPITFTQSNMPEFRQKMVWEILHQKLL
ncbi:sentrin-specific protease 2 [Bombina bombina]|uniref:sentrin-specific protease 2 n=1 Tax=Bombina bombina TaxID=8345 RepID=UPI00235A7589|nr:sentrin-specific protease 2 [Bombina bombina]